MYLNKTITVLSYYKFTLFILCLNLHCDSAYLYNYHSCSHKQFNNDYLQGRVWLYFSWKIFCQRCSHFQGSRYVLCSTHSKIGSDIFLNFASFTGLSTEHLVFCSLGIFLYDYVQWRPAMDTKCPHGICETRQHGQELILPRAAGMQLLHLFIQRHRTLSLSSHISWWRIKI